jgi:hypothetical protein
MLHKKKLLFGFIFLIYICRPFPVSAADTCCIGHGGDSYCDFTTKQLYCNDGHISAQCTCSSEATSTPTVMPTATPIPSPACPADSSFSESSDACACDSGYAVSGNVCVTYTQYCQAQYGSNAIFDSSGNTCGCSSGYTWNTAGTKCVTMDDLCNEKLGNESYFNSTNNLCYCYDGYSIQSGQCKAIPTPAVTSTQTTSEQVVPDTPAPIPTLARVVIPTHAPTKALAGKPVPTINLHKKVPGLNGYDPIKKKSNGFLADLLVALWNAIKVAFNI